MAESKTCKSNCPRDIPIMVSYSFCIITKYHLWDIIVAFGKQVQCFVEVLAYLSGGSIMVNQREARLSR